MKTTGAASFQPLIRRSLLDGLVGGQGRRLHCCCQPLRVVNFSCRHQICEVCSVKPFEVSNAEFDELTLRGSFGTHARSLSPNTSRHSRKRKAQKRRVHPKPLQPSPTFEQTTPYNIYQYVTSGHLPVPVPSQGHCAFPLLQDKFDASLC